MAGKSPDSEPGPGGMNFERFQNLWDGNAQPLPGVERLPIGGQQLELPPQQEQPTESLEQLIKEFESQGYPRDVATGLAITTRGSDLRRVQESNDLRERLINLRNSVDKGIYSEGNT